jgi:PII-like signaling protein
VIPEQAALLRLHVNGSHRWQGRPAYRSVVETARAMGLAGASVFLVDLAYGMHQQLHDARSEYRFVDVPLVIEVVDAPELIDELLRRIGPVVTGGFATIEHVRVLRYAHHGQEESAMPGAPG